MRRLCAFLILTVVKTLSHLFFQGEFVWLQGKQEKPFDNIQLLVFLNHTSLYEPLFIQALTMKFLWRMSGHISLPGADITLERPIVGLFWKLMIPRITPITRKRDDSWQNYLNSIEKDDIVFIAPEGRMKRPNGLDKHGNPMSVRGGIADILECLDQGTMFLCFSGGLHHVQAPGEKYPTPFKKLRMNFELFSIEEYKKRFSHLDAKEKKLAIIKDLQHRLETNCPPDID
ncbi:MAG: hypothetical protein ACOYL6_06065 [Bacteriovoracaceae bacterium]